jgi:hypothetical protein
MSMILDGSNGVTFNDASLQGAAASPFVLKNRIINGDMRIDQRNAGASLTITNNGQYNLDRWSIGSSQSSKLSIQQNAGSVTPPAGFTNYAGITSLAATTVGADAYSFRQQIEGYNIADLDWGTANAKTITVSFWVRSSLTGAFGASIFNSAANRVYPFSYTISSANTWTQISVTVPGDTTGTWLTTNGTGLYLYFGLGVSSSISGTANVWNAGTAFVPTSSTNVVSTNGATWYITGVQLEQNTSATPFERRLYNQELANCQRYYVQYFGTSVYEFSPSYLNGFNTTNAYGWIQVPVPMRASPSVSASTFLINDEVAARAGTSLSIYAVGQSNKLVSVLAQAASGISSSRAYNLIANNSTSAYIQISSEL